MLMQYEHPPDGGWGWAVTFTTCLGYAIGWGVPRGFSVLFQNFQENFNSTNSETSWIISLIGGFLLIGTLPGSLVNSAYGARVTMMTGGFLSCIGLVLASQSPTLNVAYVGSIITGVGFGFGYCSGSSQIGIYFDKKRSLAYGIASMGAPASSIMLPPLLVYLTDSYGWRGAVLIVAGISLHLAAGGALLRPVSVSSLFKAHAEAKDDSIQIEIPLKDWQGSAEDSLNLSSENMFLKNSIENLRPQIDQMLYPQVDTAMAYIGALTGSVAYLPHQTKDNVTLSLPHLASTRQHPLKKDIHKSADPLRKSFFHNLFKSSPKQEKKKQASTSTISRAATPLVRPKDYSSHVVTSLVISTMSSHHDLRRPQPTVSKFDRFNTYIKPYLSLLKKWRFVIFSIAGLLDFGVRLTPASFIVVHARTQGINQDLGALLLVIFAAFDLCIRPISGFLTHKIPQKHLRKGIEIFLFGSAQFLIFILNIAAPHASTFGTLSLYMALYGIANGLNSSWCFPVLSRLVPLSHLRHAIGMFHFFCGLGFLTGPPLAGFLADKTGHYYVVFYFTSIAMFFSGSLVWILYLLTRKFGIRKVKITLQTKEDSTQT